MRRGSALIHVLMLTLMLAMIASLIMQMVMHRATIAAQAAGTAQAGSQSDAAMGALWSSWSQNDATGAGVCSSLSTVACTGTPGTCDCSCTVAGYGNVVIYAAVRGTQCMTCACSPKFFTESCPAPPISAARFDEICKRW